VFGVIGDQYTGWAYSGASVRDGIVQVPSDSIIHRLGAAAGATATRGINDDGYIVGLWQAPDGAVSGYVRTPPSKKTAPEFTDIVDPTPETSKTTTEAYGINKSGRRVPQRAFLRPLGAGRMLTVHETHGGLRHERPLG
jgi:hypothetical protein